MNAPIDQDFVVDRLSHYEMVVPERSLAPRSLQVRAYKELLAYDEMYKLLQKAATYWDNFLVYTQVTAGQPSLDKWEFIPYTKDSYAWTQHIALLWSVSRGAAEQSPEKRRATLESYQGRITQVSSRQSSASGDAFCNPEVIGRQRVIAGKKIEVLFNYAPQGEEHFLIIPKEHRTDFKELQEGEFVETMQWADKIVDHYVQQGYTCYLYHKTGEHAGQTVPHWHLHIVIVKPEKDWKEKISFAWRMIAGSRPLPSTELAEHVHHLQVELKDLP